MAELYGQLFKTNLIFLVKRVDDGRKIWYITLVYHIIVSIDLEFVLLSFGLRGGFGFGKL